MERTSFIHLGQLSSLRFVTLLWVLVVFQSGCRTESPVTYQVQNLGVVTDVLPLVVQPDHSRWRALKLGQTEGEVEALLGKPYRKGPRPRPSEDPNRINLYSWTYGEITFSSFTTKGSFDYSVTFHDGRVHEVRDPWNGKFSQDGRPTVPELLLPANGQAFAHYPRFLDFRWHPSSGVYPIEYEVSIQVLEIAREEAEHFEDYVRKSVERATQEWKAAGATQKTIGESAASYTRILREGQGGSTFFRFLTHDIYLPFSWVGANTGRWRVRATNSKGSSDWSAWRYFDFSD